MRRNCFFSPLENSTKSRNATCYKHVWRARARRSRVVVYISPYWCFLHHTSLTRRLFSFFSPHFARNISLCTIVVTTRIISSNPSDDCVKFKQGHETGSHWNLHCLPGPSLTVVPTINKFSAVLSLRKYGFLIFYPTTAAVLLAFEIRKGLSRYIASFAI